MAAWEMEKRRLLMTTPEMFAAASSSSSESLELLELLLGGGTLRHLDDVEADRLGKGTALANRHGVTNPRARTAPSSGTLPPPWSASRRGWSAAGTAGGQVWCRRCFCRTASGYQQNRGIHPGPWTPWRPCTWGSSHSCSGPSCPSQSGLRSRQWSSGWG